MKAIQILMEEDLIAAVDREAKHDKTDRSKLIRAAVAGYLKEKRARALEEQDRRGYEKRPQGDDEYVPWQKAQAWPED